MAIACLRTIAIAVNEWCEVVMMRFRRWQRACVMTCLGGGMAAIAACGSETSSLTATSPAIPSTVTQATSRAGEMGDRVSAIYQGDGAEITVVDIALVLASSYLPDNRTEAVLSEAAASLLIPTQALLPLDPIPTGTNVNYAEVPGEQGRELITLEDAAVVQAAFLRAQGDRTPANLAGDAGRLLNSVGLTVRAVPGAALPSAPALLLNVGDEQLIEGQLTDDDTDNPTLAGSKSDDYLLENVPLGSAVRVDLNSVDFDARIQLLDASNPTTLLGEVDDGGAVNSAQLVFLPEENRTYIVRVTGGSDELGDYALRARPIDTPVLDVSQAAPFSGELATSDDSFEGDRFADIVRLEPADEARLITLDLEAQSANLTLQLQVIDGGTGQIVREDPNVFGSDARVQFEAEPNVPYLIRVTTATAQTGSYALSGAIASPGNVPDIVSLVTSLESDTLIFDVEFAEEIELASATSTNEIQGTLYLDIDRTVSGEPL
ncbi:MAG: hypothetical protein AAFY15_02720, partial [Cyanobacteria bacterium J06648_11]